jgi:hypothetical protein
MIEEVKRKVDIYSLYKKEKVIHIEDDANNYIDILLVKMTQGERLNILNTYNEYLETQRLKLQEREEKFHSLSLAIERYTTDDIINGLVAFESTQRSEIADLYPALENKTEEERKQIIKEEINKFEKVRKEELQKETRETLKKKFIEVTLESQVLLDSVRILNYKSIVAMCLDPETRQPLFKDAADIEKVCDRRVIDKLIEEITAFRSLEMPKEVRKIASSNSDFLAVGESQKS